MPDTGSNPFAEPDFSALQISSDPEESDDEFDDDETRTTTTSTRGRRGGRARTRTST